MERGASSLGRMQTSPSASGRPRNGDTTQRILDLCWRVIAADGIDAVDIEAIAAELGCAKTTIYRRWPSKTDLVVAAIEAGLEHGTDPATGDVVADLVEFAMVNVRNHSSRFSAFSLVSSSEVTRRLWERIFAARQAIAVTIIDRAMAAGQLPADADAIAIVDLLSGFVNFRLVARAAVEGSRAVTRDEISPIVTAIVASPPRRRP